MVLHLLFLVEIRAPELSEEFPGLTRWKLDSLIFMFCLKFHLWHPPIFKYGVSVFYGFPEKQSFLFPRAWEMVILSACLNPMDRKCLQRKKNVRVSSGLIKQHCVPEEDIFLAMMPWRRAWNWGSIPLDPAIWPCSKKTLKTPFISFTVQGTT